MTVPKRPDASQLSRDETFERTQTQPTALISKKYFPVQPSMILFNSGLPPMVVWTP